MVFIVPNEAVATYAPQSSVDSVDVDALVAGDAGNGVITGCVVGTPATPARTVDVTAGSVHINGAVVAVTAVTALAIGAASAFDRKDIVVVSSAGTVSVVAGTAATATTNGATTAGNRDPAKPAIPANSVILAEVYVNVSIGNMAAGNIVDKRVIVSESASFGPGTPSGAVTSGGVGSDMCSLTLASEVFPRVAVITAMIFGAKTVASDSFEANMKDNSGTIVSTFRDSAKSEISGHLGAVLAIPSGSSYTITTALIRIAGTGAATGSSVAKYMNIRVKTSPA